MMHRCLIHKRAQYDNFIQIFRWCFDLFKNVPHFLSLPQRQHKMQILRKLITAHSLLMLIIVYGPASEQHFYLVFISDIIYIRSH